MSLVPSAPSVSGNTIWNHPQVQQFMRERLSHVFEPPDGTRIDFCLMDMMPVDMRRFDSSTRGGIVDLQNSLRDLAREWRDEAKQAETNLELVASVLTMQARGMEAGKLTVSIESRDESGRTRTKLVGAMQILLGYHDPQLEQDDPSTKGLVPGTLPQGFNVDYPGMKSSSDETTKAMVRAHAAYIWSLRQRDVKMTQAKNLEGVIEDMGRYLDQYDKYIDEIKVRFMGAIPRSEGDALEPLPMPSSPSGKGPVGGWAQKARQAQKPNSQ